MTIIVNTVAREWAEKKITFEQIVDLAYPGQPYNPEDTTVELCRGHGPDHSLRPGESVEVKDGMSDLQARPVYNHLRDSIEAHLTIVFAALAVSRWIESTTGWSIRKFVKTAWYGLPVPGRTRHGRSP